MTSADLADAVLACNRISGSAAALDMFLDLGAEITLDALRSAVTCERDHLLLGYVHSGLEALRVLSVAAAVDRTNEICADLLVDGLDDVPQEQLRAVINAAKINSDYVRALFKRYQATKARR